MRLESVLELRQSIQLKTRLGMMLTDSDRVREDPAALPPPPMGLGVAPMGDTKDEYRLAIRVYKGRKEEADFLLADTLEKYGQEVDYVSDIEYTLQSVRLNAGDSCSHVRYTAGTLGAFVKDQDGYPCILSNNHVLANSEHLAKRFDDIWRPGRYDTASSPHHVIAHLESWAPLELGLVDAAIARIDHNIVSSFDPFVYRDIGTLNPRPIQTRYEVKDVVKLGKQTGRTCGEVTVFDLNDVVVDFGTSRKPRLITFHHQIEMAGSPRNKPFSQKGDSGALILERHTRRPYALLYGGAAGSDRYWRTIGHFIPEVLAALNVSFIES